MIGVIAFVYMFAQLLIGHDVSALLANRHFTLANFLLAMSLSASWQISFGPYVADYSRYLPRSTSARKTFWAIGLGIGAQTSMVFGVFAAALAGEQFSGHEVSFVVGLGATGKIAALLFFAIAFGKITITTLNAYGSVMSITTVVSGFRGDNRLSARSRLAYTRDRYDVPALYDPNGRYGRWNATGIVIYAIGVLVQLPFISSAFYTGPLVDSLDGADISWIVGLIVPAALYFFAARRTVSHIPAHLILPADPAFVSERVSQ